MLRINLSISTVENHGKYEENWIVHNGKIQKIDLVEQKRNNPLFHNVKNLPFSDRWSPFCNENAFIWCFDNTILGPIYCVAWAHLTVFHILPKPNFGRMWKDIAYRGWAEKWKTRGFLLLPFRMRVRIIAMHFRMQGDLLWVKKLISLPKWSTPTKPGSVPACPPLPDAPSSLREGQKAASKSLTNSRHEEGTTR